MAYFPSALSQPFAPEPTVPQVAWEETVCLLCGSRNWHTLLQAPDYQSTQQLLFAVVQCDDCGMCFTNPRPAAETLGQFYPKDYQPHTVRGKADRRLSRRDRARFERQYPPIPMHGGGRLLDFGCGGGAFLRHMQAKGWHVTGLDSSQDTVARLSQETGLSVLAGSLPHPKLGAASFDVITMWHSLEHVPDPKSVLREARRLLALNGKLIVAVPNIDSLPFRVFGHAWYGLDVPRHLSHFSPWSLHLMLERCRFRVERIRQLSYSGWLRRSAQLACRKGQEVKAERFHRLLRGRMPATLVALYSSWTGQADCILATATPAAD